MENKDIPITLGCRLFFDDAKNAIAIKSAIRMPSHEIDHMAIVLRQQADNSAIWVQRFITVDIV